MGVYWNFSQRAELRSLLAERQTLSREVGLLKIEDTQAYRIVHVPQDDSLNFFWRCYYPPKMRVEEYWAFHRSSRRQGMTYHASSSESIHRCRFSLDDDGVWVYINDRGGAALSRFGNAAVSDFMRAHWDQLKFEVAGSDTSVEIPVTKPIVLLRIYIPPELFETYSEIEGPFSKLESPDRPFFELVYGTAESMQSEPPLNWKPSN